MRAWLIVAGLAMAGLDAGVFGLAWRQRAPLSAVVAVSGVAAGLAAAVSGGGGSETRIALAAALVLGGFGIALFVLGQVVQRLLDQTPSDEA